MSKSRFVTFYTDAYIALGDELQIPTYVERIKDALMEFTLDVHVDPQIAGLEEYTTKAQFLEKLAQGCSNPDCTHDDHVLFLHSGCHPAAGVDVFYKDGFVQVRCDECEKHVIRFKVR